MTTSHRHRDSPRRRNRIIAASAAGVLLVAVVAALLLGGSEEDRSSAADRTDDTSTTTGADTTTGAATVGPDSTGAPASPGAEGTDPAEDALVTPTELEPFLLRGSDLPPGWRTLEAAGTATRTLMGACLQKAITPTVPHALKATSFRSGSEGPVLTASVRDFTTAEQSSRAMTAVRKAVLTCVNTTGKPALTPLTLTSKADASVGVTFTITQEGSSARGEVLVAKVGTRSATVALIGLTERDLELGRDSLRTMIARLD